MFHLKDQISVLRGNVVLEHALEYLISLVVVLGLTFFKLAELTVNARYSFLDLTGGKYFSSIVLREDEVLLFVVLVNLFLAAKAGLSAPEVEEILQIKREGSLADEVVARFVNRDLSIHVGEDSDEEIHHDGQDEEGGQEVHQEVDLAGRPV